MRHSGRDMCTVGPIAEGDKIRQPIAREHLNSICAAADVSHWKLLLSMIILIWMQIGKKIMTGTLLINFQHVFKVVFI